MLDEGNVEEQLRELEARYPPAHYELDTSQVKAAREHCRAA